MPKVTAHQEREQRCSYQSSRAGPTMRAAEAFASDKGLLGCSASPVTELVGLLPSAFRLALDLNPMQLKKGPQQGFQVLHTLSWIYFY